MTATGRIILLNGASSSGKSSISRALQDRLDAPFWHISIDHLRDAGVLPLARIRSGEFVWADMREAFFDGFERSLLGYTSTGNDLIVEYIVETRAGMNRLVGLMAGQDIFFVGVHCPLDELERREKSRGDRPIGDAARDFHTIHVHCDYDLEVQSLAPPGDNADRIIAAWRARSEDRAFSRMAKTGQSAIDSA
ncbi:chloramphenicol 3-O phosphotransferase [Sphingobium xanthum]|uniref:chloramphenicol phosphotransferase CPT family protein n=1 Tax=Sphingobium xanthum TaxID=1387165 RepID=UPI001C8BEAAA|nr:chloramphenicol phosphotransferase CPT family protein [Sphingobium xanthum]